CERQPCLHLKQGNTSRIIEKDGCAVGVDTSLGVSYHGQAVIVTTGTFMRGLLHVGLQNEAGGRMGDATSTLSDSLRGLGFEIGRFKTGTPCRLLARSIDFSRCGLQAGDDPPPPFTFNPEMLSPAPNDIFTLNSYREGKFHVEQIPCWI